MPIIQLEQGSQAWLDYRKKKVMATDTPAILGSNPWVTKFQKWEEKQPGFITPEINAAMKEGQIREPIARQMAIEILGINFTPIVYESDTNPWMAASLDGISDCGKYILELKCPSKEKLFTQLKEGYVPEYYSDQMQHQYATLPNVELVIYGVYFPLSKDNPIIFKYMDRDLEKEALIIKKGREFYINMCNMNPPVEWVFERNN